MPLHFLGKLRVLLTMHNPGSPGHGNGFSLGFHLMPSKVEPMSSRFHLSRHPAPRPAPLPTECLLFYWDKSEIREQSENNSVTAHACKTPTEDLSPGRRQTAGEPSALRSLTSAGHTCLWPMLLNKRTSTLFLLFNLAHRL